MTAERASSIHMLMLERIAAGETIVLELFSGFICAKWNRSIIMLKITPVISFQYDQRESNRIYRSILYLI